MRLPWLQIDADGVTRGRLLGRLLNVHEHHGVGIALALWHWALEMSPEGDFSGDVPGDAELLAAALSWPIGDTQRLVVQLQRVGLVATSPTFRVRGLGRYRRTWEKNQRNRFSEANQPKSGGRVPGSGAGSAGKVPGSGANPARETETETEKKETSVAKKPRQPRESDVVCDEFRKLRGVEYVWQGAKDGAAWASLRRHASAEEICDRWRRGLAATGWLKVASIAQLASKWNDLAASSDGYQESIHV